MTITLNASTASGLVVTPDNSGNIVLQYNGIAAPTFSAYQSSGQSISANTWTKVSLQTEEWDTANCFDNSSTYHFTPTVAGYYQVNGSVRQDASSNPVGAAIYKNGSAYRYGQQIIMSTGSSTLTIAVVTSLVYLNGTTDYIALWGYSQAGGTLNGTSTSTYMNACLLRGA